MTRLSFATLAMTTLIVSCGGGGGGSTAPQDIPLTREELDAYAKMFGVGYVTMRAVNELAALAPAAKYVVRNVGTAPCATTSDGGQGTLTSPFSQITATLSSCVIPITAADNFDVSNAPSGGAFTGTFSPDRIVADAAGDSQFSEFYRAGGVDISRGTAPRPTLIVPDINDYTVTGSFDVRLQYSDAFRAADVSLGGNNDSVMIDFGQSQYSVRFVDDPNSFFPSACRVLALGQQGGYQQNCSIEIGVGPDRLRFAGGLRSEDGEFPTGGFRITVPATGLEVVYFIGADRTINIEEGLFKEATVSFDDALIQSAISEAMD